MHNASSKALISIDPIVVGDIVGNKYKTENLLATGSNITIFSARFINGMSTDLLALKTELYVHGEPVLNREAIAIDSLEGIH
jgi:hypothetical protein